MLFLCGIRRLPIFPGSAHMVAARRTGRPFLQLPVLEQGPLAVSSTGCARAPCVSSQVRTVCVMAEVRPGKIHCHQRPKKNTMHLHGVLLWYPAATYLSHSVRNSRAALPTARLPCAPLLTGCSPPCIRHWRRSAPSHLQPSDTYSILLKYKPGKVGRCRRHKKQDALLCVLLLWYPAATYLSGPSPAKYCRRIRA